MSYKNKLVRGALLLTAVGFLSRLMGFFYRIFLSHTFSEEAIGLYQLIFPIFALCIAGCCAGIETALSRTISRKCGTTLFPARPRSVSSVFSLSSDSSPDLFLANCCLYFKRTSLSTPFTPAFLCITLRFHSRMCLWVFFRSAENRRSCHLTTDGAALSNRNCLPGLYHSFQKWTVSIHFLCCFWSGCRRIHCRILFPVARF